MNHALTLPRPAPLRIGRLLILTVAFWLACGVSLAPTLIRTAAVANHSQVCKCAHCSGGPTCFCRLAGKCPAP